MSGTRAIEIVFAEPVELTREDEKQLVDLADRICRRYQEAHPARVMWPFGIGFKPTYIPMTPEEEACRGMEFDEGTFQIECAEREDYDFKCAACGKPQGDHKHCYMPDPPAGECEFVLTNA